MKMRKAPCVVLIWLGTVSWGIPSFSATDVLVGVKGGLSLANLTGEDVYNNSTSPGVTGGAFARYHFTNMFSLQPEVLFAMKGAEFAVGDIEAEQTSNYLEIPILFRVAWPSENKFEPSLFVGPALGILLSNKITDGAKIDLNDASKSTDFGVVVGAGLDCTLGNGRVLLDVRYERGFTSWSDDLDEKHSVVSFMIGYGIRV